MLHQRKGLPSTGHHGYSERTEWVMDAQVSWKSLPGSYGYSLGQTMRLVWSHRSQSDHHSSCLCQQENALSQYNCDAAVKREVHRSLVHPHWFTSQRFMKSGKQCTQLISINHINQSLGSIIDLWRWLFLHRSECSSGSICHCRWRTLFLLLSLCLSLCLCLCHWLFSRWPSTVAASLTARLMISPKSNTTWRNFKILFEASAINPAVTAEPLCQSLIS